MLHSSDPRYQYCARVGKSVCVCRSEVECRREHGCINLNCPLVTAFGLQAFDERMRAFATTFDLWPLGGSSQIFPSS
jgi:hypothetical protein